MDLSVFSEIDQLAQVLVHRPGNEVECMTPSLMEELLFDDVIYSKTAKKEHDLFTGVMRAHGVNVTFFQDLLRDALKIDEDLTRRLVNRIVVTESMPPESEDMIKSLDHDELAHVLIEGLRAPGNDPDHLFDLGPLPNLLFSRDAQIVLGDTILFSSMKNTARVRESLLSSFVFQTGRGLSPDNVLGDLSGLRLQSRANVFGAATIEGGDVLVFEDGVCVVGMSERTSKQGIVALRRLLRKSESFKKLVVVLMPENRAQMHLDTIFTRISQEEVLVYSPMMLSGQSQTLGALVYSLSGDQNDSRAHYYESTLQALSSTGIDVKPVYCGGRDSFIEQSREQWTDGANAFALKDGVICLYDRNVRTLEELDKSGYDVVHARTLDLDGVREMPTRKTVFVFPSHELSRARGGPRCMTMPLRRLSPGA
ncbi:MAG: arginine deiminase family protein [Gammaproteobacteria bacterium]